MARITTIPARFGREPVDLRGYDRWQDGEGLVDASEACRSAWAAWAPVWREARAVDLARPRPDPPPVRWYDSLTPRQQHGARRARVIGAAWAMCAARERRRPLTADERAAWVRWRARVLRADPSLWLALWPLIDGEQISDVAECRGLDEKWLKSASGRCLEWFLDELYPSTIG